MRCCVPVDDEAEEDATAWSFLSSAPSTTGELDPPEAASEAVESVSGLATALYDSAILGSNRCVSRRKAEITRTL